jgi:hypothetical protein
MKKTRCADVKTIVVLCEAEAGTIIPELCSTTLTTSALGNARARLHDRDAAQPAR